MVRDGPVGLGAIRFYESAQRFLCPSPEAQKMRIGQRFFARFPGTVFAMVSLAVWHSFRQ